MTSDKETLEKIKDFINHPIDKNRDYLSVHWKKIIESNIEEFSFDKVIKDIQSSYYLDHYTIFQNTDSFVKHKDVRDKLLIRKTLLSSLISNPILTLKVLKKMFNRSKSRDSLFFTQSLTLERINLLDDYFSYMFKNNYLTDFTSQRLYYYFKIQDILLHKYFKKKESNILEIGAGGGTSAIYLIKNQSIKNYIIVDLPEMLIFSSYHIKKHCDNFQINFELPTSKDLTNGSNSIFFITPDQLELLPDQNIDFQFSINALMEMKINIAENYIKQMYRLGSDESITMIVARINELELKEEVDEINNPYTYSYNSADKVVSFGPDFLQDFSRSMLRKQPISPSMIRIAKINSNDQSVKKLNLHRILNFKEL